MKSFVYDNALYFLFLFPILLVLIRVVDLEVGSLGKMELEDLRGKLYLAKQECAHLGDELARCYSSTEDEMVALKLQHWALNVYLCEASGEVSLHKEIEENVVALLHIANSPVDEDSS